MCRGQAVIVDYININCRSTVCEANEEILTNVPNTLAITRQVK